ncbi:TPA: hypothetical protein ACKPYW_001125 [Pseudomonas aeruginosa]
MTDRRVAAQRAETASQAAPGNAASSLRSEVLSRAGAGSAAASFTPEILSAPWPPTLATHWQVEALARPWPPLVGPVFVVEVLRRDTASSAIVATGMDAFGDTPWLDAQRGVFAFRHDWAEPLVERFEWQTSVTRLTSGNESRQAQRKVPRRSLSYHVGHARASDALVADWLADHLGKAAWWPLPQYAVPLTSSAEAGAFALEVAKTDWRHFAPARADLRLTWNGVEGWDGADLCALVIAPDGWQQVALSGVDSDMLWLAEPLARAVPMGASVMPLVWGRAADPAELSQWVPGMVGGTVTAQLEPTLPPDAGWLDDPWLDELPVWPDGNWRDDPSVSAQATITRQDFSPADPWLRRDDPWPVAAFQRRYLASTPEEIEIWRERLWQTEGRLNAFWLPDGLAPILRVIVDTDPQDGFLRVDGKDLSAFWHRPAAGLIVHPDGTRQYALTATCHLDQGGVLVLRSGLDEWVPKGSRVIRLVRCRLDHDAIDLYWHSPELVEISLTARQLPEPRGNDRASYGEYAV